MEEKTSKKRTKDQFTVVLERVESKIDLVVEGQQALREDFDQFKTETESNFRYIMDYLVRIEAEIMEMKDEIRDLRKTLEKKADLDRLETLEHRIKIIEKVLMKQKILNGAQ